jgi:hypothetical protein
MLFVAVSLPRGPGNPLVLGALISPFRLMALAECRPILGLGGLELVLVVLRELPSLALERPADPLPVLAVLFLQFAVFTGENCWLGRRRLRFARG